MNVERNYSIQAVCVECGKEIELRMSKGEYETEFLREALIKASVCEACAEIENQKANTKAQAETEARKAFQAKETFVSRLNKSRLENYHLDYNPSHPNANKNLFDWVEQNQNKNLLLAGDTGTCKTRILQFFAKKQLEKGKTVLFAPVADILDEIGDAYRRESAGQALMREIKSFDLLILDDLGKDAETPSKLQRLWQLIDRRYVRSDQEANIAAGRWNPLYAKKDRCDGWQIWITTNCPSKDLISKFDRFKNEAGKPIMRRLQDVCEIWPVKNKR